MCIRSHTRERRERGRERADMTVQPLVKPAQNIQVLPSGLPQSGMALSPTFPGLCRILPEKDTKCCRINRPNPWTGSADTPCQLKYPLARLDDTAGGPN